jgi:hypothetical protein
MFEAAILTGIGIIWILSRMNLRRVAGYALAWDVGLMALLTWMFIGTYAGMVTGMMASVIVSAFLTVVKKKNGAERLKLVRKKDKAFPELKWRDVQ